MENASKALIMAGGILIGVLIISLAVYLFVDFGSTSAQINAQNAQKQLTEFNTKFTSYEDYKDKDGNWKITIYDLITLAGYAKENNEYYEVSEGEENFIDVKIGNNSILHTTEITLINKYVNQDNGLLTKFEWKETEYYSNGRIKFIKFQAIK